MKGSSSSGNSASRRSWFNIMNKAKDMGNEKEDMNEEDEHLQEDDPMEQEAPIDDNNVQNIAIHQTTSSIN